MRAKAVGLFLSGFLAGAVFLYYLLWRTGALVPGHPLTLTTHDLVHRVAATPAPLATIPFPTATPTATAATTATVAAGTAGLTPDPMPARAPAALTTPLLSHFSLGPEVLAVPVEGAGRSDLHDSFAEARGGHRHEAIDILAPRGTPVLAAVEGTIAKLFTSVRGGLTVYEFDRQSNYCYYYAHLDRYAEGLREGRSVARGERIGYVGTTGDAPPQTPHLHFAIFKLGPDRRWWEGVAVNPYPQLLAATSPATGG